MDGVGVDLREAGVQRVDVRLAEPVVLQLHDPRLHVRRLDAREATRSELCLDPSDVRPGLADGRCPMRCVALEPRRAPLPYRRLRRLRLDVGAGMDTRRHAVEPARRVNLAVEVPRVLLAGVVSISCSVPAIGPFGNALARHDELSSRALRLFGRPVSLTGGAAACLR
jgi:hypothetical protein